MCRRNIDYKWCNDRNHAFNIRKHHKHLCERAIGRRRSRPCEPVEDNWVLKDTVGECGICAQRKWCQRHEEGYLSQQRINLASGQERGANNVDEKLENVRRILALIHQLYAASENTDEIIRVERRLEAIDIRP